MVREIRVNKEVVFGSPEGPLVLIAGPCVLESVEDALLIGARIKELTEEYGLQYVFKASYDKANRSSIDSYRGPGLERGLEMLARIGEELEVPVLSDVHSPEEARQAAEVLDIIQVPAFLSRQTDLLVACGETGRVVNVKKGQFLAPWDMEQVVGKLESTGCREILLTERGSSFGYNNLVVDMSSLPRMRKTGYPVVFDATHSVQLPGGAGDVSGGEREYIPHLARAALGVGIDALFLEVHHQPEEALCDASSMLALEGLEELLKGAVAIHSAVRKVKD